MLFLSFYIAVKDKKSCNTLPRMDEDTCLFPVNEKSVEYYFASDARSVPFCFASPIHFLCWFYLKVPLFWVMKG